MDEMILEMREKIDYFFLDKYLIIQNAYPDFQNYFQLNVYYRSDLEAAKKAQFNDASGKI